MTLQVIVTPLEAYRPLQHRHKWMLQVLLSFADRNGKCWPSLRTLAEHAGEGLSWVQRNLAEMEGLGYFKRWRRSGISYLYKVAERFIPRWSGVSRRQDSPERQSQPATQRVFREPSPADRTEGESKHKQQEDLRSREDGLGRCAPSEADKAAVDEACYQARAHLTGRSVAAIKRKEIADKEAHAAAVTENRFKLWLAGARCNGGLYRWCCETFSGGQLQAFTTAIDEALRAGSRKATPQETMKALDQLDKLYRKQQAAIVSHVNERSKSIRDASIKRSNRLDGVEKCAA